MLGESCKKCKLYKGCKSPFMSGSGSDQPDILFIGEAPGANEDEQGEPFVGRSGEILREAIEILELSPDQYRFTYTVRCRPPDNKTPTKTQLSYCSEYLMDEIKRVKPAVMVLLGNSPLKSVLGESGITNWNGVVVERDSGTYIPAFHPSYILKNGGREDLLQEWMAALEKASQAAEGRNFKRADLHYEYLFPKTLEELYLMEDDIMSRGELVAYDIETKWLDEVKTGNKILTVALAVSDKAWSFPIDHKESWWTEEERDEVISILCNILESYEGFMEVGEFIDLEDGRKAARIITHTKFDCKLTRRLLGINFFQYGDTIHLSRLINSNSYEHGLKRLAGLELRMFDYDRALGEYISEHPETDYSLGGHYGNVPLDILLPYGGMDVAATWLLHDKLFPKLTDKQRALYLEMIIPADYMLGKIESNGFKLDYDMINRYRVIYEHIQAEHYRQLLDNVDVMMFVHDKEVENADDFDENRLGVPLKNLHKLLEQKLDDWHKGNEAELSKLDDKEFFKAYRKKYWEVRFELADKLALKKTRAKRSTNEFEFNPNSSYQMIELLYDRIGYPVPGWTETGQPSVKKDLLKEIIYDYEQEGREEELEVLNLYMSWKLLSTILSKTFYSMLDETGDWYHEDGRSRSDYHLGGTKTGRIASRNPNLQNIPSVESEPGTVLQYLPVKNAFTHTWEGGCLAMLDYAGMELRVMASVAGIQGMVDVFARDGDVHRYVSSLIYKKPEDEITKFERYRGKWCNWSLLYLGGWHTLYNLYRINGLTEDEAKRITELYYNSFPELQVYHSDTISFAKEHGYVESPFGRRLLLPELGFGDDDAKARQAMRTGVNMPIQGTASDTLMVASAIIDYYMEVEGFRSMLVNTVHDSLVGDIYPGELKAFTELAVDVMENVTAYARDFMPNIDFSWLKVPLKADVDIGASYGTYGEPIKPVCDACGSKLNYVGDNGSEVFLACGSCGDTSEMELELTPGFVRYYNNNNPEVKMNSKILGSVLKFGDPTTPERRVARVVA